MFFIKSIVFTHSFILHNKPHKGSCYLWIYFCWKMDDICSSLKARENLCSSFVTACVLCESKCWDKMTKQPPKNWWWWWWWWW